MKASNANKGGCVVRKCHCKSDFQDKEYGKGLRLHTVCDKGQRCTVCGSVKDM